MKINKEIRDVLLNRLLFSLGILLLIRVGTFLPVPGINHNDLAFYIQRHSVTKSLVSTFSGDNTFVIGLFTLNIFPYINATILVQLLLGFIYGKVIAFISGKIFKVNNPITNVLSPENVLIKFLATECL